MKEQILKIAEQLKYDEITTDYAQSLLLALFGVSDWVRVSKEVPPNDVGVLAKAPDGTVYLTNWRPAYNIFCCQCKGECSYDWRWKLV